VQWPVPLGKHHPSRVLSVFDVAVGHKNLLRDLISCSAQDQAVREVSSQEADSCGDQAEANNLPQSETPDEGNPDLLLRASPCPGPEEAEVSCLGACCGSHLGSQGCGSR
ncbi:ZBT40 protein, partial [Indicator maculatus]|nr:ZBT40 protein [Indicator maculatus]